MDLDLEKLVSRAEKRERTVPHYPPQPRSNAG